ncbi:hypothetical protein Pelo_16377 [Pelomyxa schiedti]|nr:hypothetical protein Pelo_16377 [Pelomyxa schiedti]
MMTTKSRNGPRVGPWGWFQAARRGDSDALRRLLAADRDLLNSVSREPQLVTALHVATWSGKAQCVEFLLSMNVDVNSQVFLRCSLTHKLVSLTSQIELPVRTAITLNPFYCVYSSIF